MPPKVPVPKARPRKTSEVVRTRPGCVPLRDAYDWAVANKVTSWNQVEPYFLNAMSAFDSTLADTLHGTGDDAIRKADLQAVIRWSNVALQVVDAVGLYAYEPTPGTVGWTTYRRRAGVPTVLELERVLFRACQELKSLKGKEAPQTGAAPPGPAATAPDS